MKDTFTMVQTKLWHTQNRRICMYIFFPFQFRNSEIKERTMKTMNKKGKLIEVLIWFVPSCIPRQSYQKARAIACQNTIFFFFRSKKAEKLRAIGKVKKSGQKTVNLLYIFTQIHCISDCITCPHDQELLPMITSPFCHISGILSNENLALLSS